jgi:hypothetical protein
MGQGIKELHSKMKKEVLKVRRDYEEKMQKLEKEIEMLKALVEGLLLKKEKNEEEKKDH